MKYFGMYRDVLEEFAEASHFGREQLSRVDRAYYERKYADEESRKSRGWHAAHPRREYRTAKQVDYEMREIRRRLLAGDRPKKWGKRWRIVAAELGIERKAAA